MGINDKYKKSKYADLEHVKGKPFVIAIAPFEQNAFFIQNNQAINLVLYGQRIKTKINENKEIIAEFVNIDKIDKNQNTQLDVGLFTTDKYKEISAIIFSTPLLDGLQIHRNPFAEIPLDLKECVYRRTWSPKSETLGQFI